MKDVNKHFTKYDIQIASKHMERYSTSSFIWKMKIKTAVKFYTPIRMTKI